MKPQQRKQKPPAFDDYATNYSTLIRDPIRDRFASAGGFFFERKLQIIRRFFQRGGVQTKGLDWLDIGCGQGDLLRHGRGYFRSAAGCDPSQGMLNFCQDLDVRHQLSMDSLPFGDGVCDFVTAVCVYHHVPVELRPKLTAEALRVLKPGGTLCIIEHNPWNPVTKLIVSRALVDKDAHLLSPGETKRLLSAAGCKIFQTQFFLLFPELLHRFTRPIEDALRVFPLGGQYAVFGNSGTAP